MTGSPDSWYRRLELTREEVRVLQRAIRYGDDYPESDKDVYWQLVALIEDL